MSHAEMIFKNANIRTMNDNKPKAEALAVAHGKIVFVGDDKEAASFQGPDTKIVDLDGQTVLPGFSDNHMHALAYGISLIEVPLSGLTSIKEVVKRVREKAQTLPRHKWILGRGWDQNQYVEDRYFNKSDLDEAASEHPVALIRVCGHVMTVNSKALEIAGINKDTPDPSGGKIDRDPQTNEPNGILREEAMRMVKQIIPPYTMEDKKKALSKAMSEALAVGITSVTTDDAVLAGGVDSCITLYRNIWDEEQPAVRAYLLIAGEYLDDLIKSERMTGWGDDRVQVGPLKLFQDGSLGARTAAMLEPYHDSPDEKGVLIFSQQELDDIIEKAHKKGMQIAVHAIGDAAITSTLEGIEKAQDKEPKKDCRHRIIHFEVVNEDILQKTKELGIIADIQPKFLTTDGDWLDKRLGPERARYACAWKTILERGIPAVGGSDCPVEPFNPLLGIHAAVTRKVYNSPEDSWMPQEKLSVEEAVKLFTVDGAYGSFDEHKKGSLEKGKLADMVVLDKDPWTVEPETIKDINVLMTMVDGDVKYQK